jgi:hypothetical protein
LYQAARVGRFRGIAIACSSELLESKTLRFGLVTFHPTSLDLLSAEDFKEAKNPLALHVIQPDLTLGLLARALLDTLPSSEEDERRYRLTGVGRDNMLW